MFYVLMEIQAVSIFWLRLVLIISILLISGFTIAPSPNHPNVLLAGLFDESNGDEEPFPEEDEQQDDDHLHNGQDNHCWAKKAELL